MNLTLNADWTVQLMRLIAEAQAWYLLQPPTTSRLSETVPFRTLMPDVLETDRKRVVHSVTDARGGRVRRRGLPESDRPESIGRLVGFEPDETLSDGAAEAASRGFFDNRNTPPWDIWLDYVMDARGTGCLISWVPDEWIDLVSKGIASNPEECIFWLPELDALVLHGE